MLRHIAVVLRGRKTTLQSFLFSPYPASYSVARPYSRMLSASSPLLAPANQSNQSIGSNTWKRLGLNGEPSERSSHPMTSIGNKIYLVGGEDTPRNPINMNVHQFDLDSNAWSEFKGQNAPLPTLGHTLIPFNNKLYLFGGRNKDAQDLNQLYSFDPAKQLWQKIEAENPAPPRSYHTASIVGDKMFLFGGCGLKNCRLNDIHCFDITRQKWTTYLPNDASKETPKPRGGASMTAFIIPGTNDYEIFVYGGFAGYELGDAWFFNTKTKEWTEVQTTGSAPEKRSVFGYTVLGDPTKDKSGCRFVIFGGEGAPSKQGHLGAGNFFGDTFTLNFQNLHWQQVPTKEAHDKDSQIGSRGWLPMAAIGHNQVVVHGGLNQENSRLRGLYQLKIF